MIKRIARVLCTLENSDLCASQDPMRAQLVSATGLRFAPNKPNYRVWRNYKRVFGCCMLAADVGGKMICTELCHKVADESPDAMAADAYFSHFLRRFSYPSPVFEGYVNRGNQVFPAAAILKLLLARSRGGQPAVVEIDEIVNLIVANNCTGLEPVSHYESLSPRHHSPATDEVRQIRELVRFLSQISFLKWIEPRLYLDVDANNAEALALVEALAEPIRRDRKSNASLELLGLGKTGDLPVVPLILAPATEADIYFSEGKAKRVSHLRYERSPKLREMYFRASHEPFICDMCVLDVSNRYPWADNLLELHHLLPLASPLRIETRRTSLAELVAICPSCHKATHIYYRDWLDAHEQDDFASYIEAREVYRLAKDAVVATN